MMMDDTIELPGNPGREFLASEDYCKDDALHTRQTINGIYLYQTIDWFLEFAPTANDNDHYKQEFWALVRDECGIKSERLTPNNVEKIYKAFQDMRVLYQKHQHRKYPAAEKGPVADENIFFIDLLDETGIRFYEGYSRFQLHYGLRRDDNFGERMASRVLQWRLRLKEPKRRELLLGFPKMAHDVLPIEKQDGNFKQMAENYALQFDKVSCKTSVAIADDDDVMQNVDVWNDSPKMVMLKKLDLNLTHMKADLKKHSDNMKAMFAKMSDENDKRLEMLRKDHDEVRAKVDSLKTEQMALAQSLATLADVSKDTKAKVSLIFRNRL
ncbi:hypothetical protein SLS53_008971 [Cytospora paraplurivora]|uniref:Uncharacterized protein n=1 Tax=Cytospora paraplurivora TaxID=2898453 RepID=A0AAN9YCA9_9PEZI